MTDEIDTRSRTRRWLAVGTVAVVLPLLAALVLVWTTSDRRDRIDLIPVAIVNNDTIITEPQPMAAGRALSASLTDPTHGDEKLDWTLTDSDDAKEGLRDGTYYAVLTIPSDFSKAILSTGTDSPERGQVDLESNAAASRTVPYISKAVVAAAAQALGNQSTQGYLKQVYAGFNKIADGQKNAAASAQQLASGTASLSQGAAQLDEGADQLAGATGQLAGGANQLAGATASLSGGAADLAQGSHALADGTHRLRSAAGGLADDAGRLAAGATDYATRTERAARASSGVAAGADRMREASRRLAVDLRQLVRECRRAGGSRPFCVSLRAAHLRSLGVSVGARVLARSTHGLARGVGALSAGARGLAAGDRALAAGARSLHGATQELGTSADGLATGADDLSSGASEVDASTGRLASGASSAAGAASSLASGADTLRTSSGQVDNGAQQLSSGLAKAAKESPTYSDSEQDALADTVSQPVQLNTTTQNDAHANGFLIGALVGVLLWLAALAAAWRLDVSAARRLALSPISSGRIALAQARPAVALALVQAVAVVVALLIGGVDMASAVGVTLISLLAAVSFSLVAYAMRLAGGATGVALFVLLLLVQIVALDNVVPLETAPGVVRQLNGLLPLTAYSDAVTRLVSGGEVTSVVGPVVVLVLWGLVAAVGVLLAVRRKRLLAPSAAPTPAFGARPRAGSR